MNYGFLPVVEDIKLRRCKINMFQRLLLNTALLTLSTLMAGSLAHAWSEPAIAPIMMTAPLTPPPVTGTTFYVDKSNLGGTCNNANPGTQTQPWCTIAKAMQTLTAGQRAYVRAGTYTEGNLRPTNSGTAGNYITFERFPGDTQPVINCAGATWCIDSFTAPAKSFLVFNGFEMMNPVQQFLVCNPSSGCHHMWFVNGKYHDSGSGFAGFIMDGSNHVLSNNEIYNSDTAPVMMGGGGGNNNIFEFNVLHDNGRNGDDEGGMKCGGQGYNCVIRYNTAYNNWRSPSSSRPCFSPGNCKGISGLYIDIGRDTPNGGLSYIYNNVVHDNDIGIEVFNSQGVRVFNNLVYHNGFTPGNYTNNPTYGNGLSMVGFDALDLHAYNNTVYNNSTIGMSFGVSPTAQLTTRNNTFMNNGSYEIESNGGAVNGNFDYDLITDTGGGTLIRWNNVNYASLAAFLARSGNTTETHAISSDPQFVSTSTGDFRLQTSSPAKDAGQTQTLFNFDRNNVLRPQGSAWDMGACEFATTQTPNAPTNLRVLSTTP
jgi:parallel beta-helix repeat protein